MAQRIVGAKLPVLTANAMRKILFCTANAQFFAFLPATNARGPQLRASCVMLERAYLTRFLYSSVRVSISILSPISTKAGTISSKPVPMVAGLSTLPEVSPFTAGSV